MFYFSVTLIAKLKSCGEEFLIFRLPKIIAFQYYVLNHLMGPRHWNSCGQAGQDRPLVKCGDQPPHPCFSCCFSLSFIARPWTCHQKTGSPRMWWHVLVFKGRLSWLCRAHCEPSSSTCTSLLRKPCFNQGSGILPLLAWGGGILILNTLVCEIER